MGGTKPKRTREPTGPRQRRQARRYQTRSLPSFPFGEVVDLSAGGMRVRRNGAPIVAEGSVERFTLVAGAGPIHLTGRVAWIRRKGLLARTHEYGVEFLELDNELRARLRHIGQKGHDSGPSPEEAEAQARRRIYASVEVEDLYPILGVEPDAPADELARAYRGLVRRWHPDVCAEPDAGAQLARVTKAYKILRDPDLRARYDEMRSSAGQIIPPEIGGSAQAA
ncbi:MAG: DnaJ domain-containing protein [Phycisphaeraceae bacterium]|nr:DnaJ domain-containing protein [Phycisphaeraceae bacterium]